MYFFFEPFLVATIDSRVDSQAEETSIRVLLLTILASILWLISSSASTSGSESRSSAGVALSDCCGEIAMGAGVRTVEVSEGAVFEAVLT